MTQKSLAENIYDVGELMADNLTTMGVVGADADDGLTTLAGKILDIPPTPVGVKIDTWTDFQSSASSVSVNQSFTVSGLVGAYHDDEVIDFIGYLKGATVKIYNGNVLLGSATTDNNGEFTYTVTPTVAGTMSLKAEFETIDDYTGSVSSTVSVEVTSFTGIDLTSNKSILSYVDGDTCTLSAQLVDASDNPVAIEGVTVTFKKGSTSLGTANTNSSGIATMTYTSAGVGDVSLTAEVGMIVSESFVVEDCSYYHEQAFTSTQNNFNVSLPSNFELSFITKRTSGSSNSSYLEIGGDSGNTALIGQVGGSGNTDCRIYASESSSSYTSHTNNSTPINADALHIWTHNGSNNTYSMNSNEVTFTDSTTHSKIRKLSITNNIVEKLKIKPL